MPLSFASPPRTAMLTSADSATDVPWRAVPAAALATNFWPSCIQTAPVRVNTHAAPGGPTPKGLALSDGSSGPPRPAVLPSADKATDVPWRALPAAALPTNFLPCCVQTPPERVKIHAAPMLLLSAGPPTMAVLPSPDNATTMPWRALPASPVPTSLLPCCAHASPTRVNIHAPSVRHPPRIAVLPSAESATDTPCPGDSFDSAALRLLPTSFLPCCVQ